MTLRFEIYGSFSWEKVTLSTSECVEHIVSISPDYYAGEMEGLVAKVNKLTEIVAHVIDALPEDQQRLFVSQFLPEAVELLR